MTKTRRLVDRIVAQLMIILCTVGILFTPVQTAKAASFEDAFRYFGETLQDWSVLNTIALATSASDLTGDSRVITCVYHSDDEAGTYAAKVTNGHISVAKDIVDSFVTEDLWNSFREQVVIGEGQSLVKVEYSSKKVSANKANGCSAALYSELKSAYSEISGGTQANDFVISVLGDNIKPEANELTDATLNKVFLFSNTIIYIGMSILSVYFALTVIGDLAFLIAPTFRRFLLSTETTEVKDSDNKKRRVKIIASGFVTETAYKSMSLEKNEQGGYSLGDAAKVGIDFLAPDWKYYFTHKALVWIGITVMLIIFWSGQLGQLASLVLEFINWIYNVILNLIRG